MLRQRTKRRVRLDKKHAKPTKHRKNTLQTLSSPTFKSTTVSHSNSNFSRKISFNTSKADSHNVSAVQLPRSRTFTRMLVVDAFSILFRSHFAMQKNHVRRPQDGRVVSGLSGFSNTLTRVANEVKPTHIAVCLDTPATIGFRRKIFADYKKDRGARDDDLVWQIQQLPYVVQSMGIPTLFVPGYEADDVIASVCEKVKQDKLSYKQLYPHKSDFFDDGYGVFGENNQTNATVWSKDFYMVKIRSNLHHAPSTTAQKTPAEQQESQRISRETEKLLTASSLLTQLSSLSNSQSTPLPSQAIPKDSLFGDKLDELQGAEDQLPSVMIPQNRAMTHFFRRKRHTFSLHPIPQHLEFTVSISSPLKLSPVAQHHVDHIKQTIQHIRQLTDGHGSMHDIDGLHALSSFQDTPPSDTQQQERSHEVNPSFTPIEFMIEHINVLLLNSKGYIPSDVLAEYYAYRQKFPYILHQSNSRNNLVYTEDDNLTHTSVRLKLLFHIIREMTESEYPLLRFNQKIEKIQSSMIKSYKSAIKTHYTADVEPPKQTRPRKSVRKMQVVEEVSLTEILDLVKPRARQRKLTSSEDSDSTPNPTPKSMAKARRKRRDTSPEILSPLPHTQPAEKNNDVEQLQGLAPDQDIDLASPTPQGSIKQPKTKDTQSIDDNDVITISSHSMHANNSDEENDSPTINHMPSQKKSARISLLHHNDASDGIDPFSIHQLSQQAALNRKIDATPTTSNTEKTRSRKRKNKPEDAKWDLISLQFDIAREMVETQQSTHDEVLQRLDLNQSLRYHLDGDSSDSTSTVEFPIELNFLDSLRSHPVAPIRNTNMQPAPAVPELAPTDADTDHMLDTVLDNTDSSLSLSSQRLPDKKARKTYRAVLGGEFKAQKTFTTPPQTPPIHIDAMKRDDGATPDAASVASDHYSSTLRQDNITSQYPETSNLTKIQSEQDTSPTVDGSKTDEAHDQCPTLLFHDYQSIVDDIIHNDNTDVIQRPNEPTAPVKFNDDNVYWGSTHHKAIRNLLYRSLDTYHEVKKSNENIDDEYLDEFSRIFDEFSPKSAINGSSSPDGDIDDEMESAINMKVYKNYNQNNQKQPLSRSSTKVYSIRNVIENPLYGSDGSNTPDDINGDSHSHSDCLNTSFPSPLQSFSTPYIPFPTNNNGIYSHYTSPLSTPSYYDNLYYLLSKFKDDFSHHTFSHETSLNNDYYHTLNISQKLHAIYKRQLRHTKRSGSDSTTPVPVTPTPLPVTMHRYAHNTSPSLPLSYPITLEDEQGTVYDIRTRQAKYDAFATVYQKIPTSMTARFSSTEESPMPLFTVDRYPRVYPSVALPPQMLPIKLNPYLTFTTQYNRKVIENISQRDVVKYGLYSMSTFSMNDPHSLYYNNFIPRFNTIVERGQDIWDPHTHRRVSQNGTASQDHFLSGQFDPSREKNGTMDTIETSDAVIHTQSGDDFSLFLDDDQDKSHAEVRAASLSLSQTLTKTPPSNPTHPHDNAVQNTQHATIPGHRVPLLPMSWFSHYNYHRDSPAYKGPSDGWWTPRLNISTTHGVHYIKDAYSKSYGSKIKHITQLNRKEAISPTSIAESSLDRALLPDDDAINQSTAVPRSPHHPQTQPDNDETEDGSLNANRLFVNAMKDAYTVGSGIHRHTYDQAGLIDPKSLSHSQKMIEHLYNTSAPHPPANLLNSIAPPSLSSWLPLIDHVYVVSGDKDIEQVVSPYVTLIKHNNSAGIKKSLRKFTPHKTTKALRELMSQHMYGGSLSDYPFTPISTHDTSVADDLSDVKLPEHASASGWTPHDRTKEEHPTRQKLHDDDDSTAPVDPVQTIRTIFDKLGSASSINSVIDPNPTLGSHGFDNPSMQSYSVHDYSSLIKQHQMCPTQLPHFQALSGDASDNVPGVPGIGPVIAQKLVTLYGDINNIVNIASMFLGYDSIQTKVLIDRIFARQRKEQEAANHHSKHAQDQGQQNNDHFTYTHKTTPPQDREDIFFDPIVHRPYIHENTPDGAKQTKLIQQSTYEANQLLLQRQQCALALGWPLSEKATRNLLDNLDLLVLSLSLVTMRNDLPVVPPQHCLYVGTDVKALKDVTAQYAMNANKNILLDMADTNEEVVKKASYNGDYGHISLDAGLYLHQYRQTKSIKRSDVEVTPDVEGFLSYHHNIPFKTGHNPESKLSPKTYASFSHDKVQFEGRKVSGAPSVQEIAKSAFQRPSYATFGMGSLSGHYDTPTDPFNSSRHYNLLEKQGKNESAAPPNARKSSISDSRMSMNGTNKSTVLVDRYGNPVVFQPHHINAQFVFNLDDDSNFQAFSCDDPMSMKPNASNQNNLQEDNELDNTIVSSSFIPSKPHHFPSTKARCKINHIDFIKTVSNTSAKWLSRMANACLSSDMNLHPLPLTTSRRQLSTKSDSPQEPQINVQSSNPSQKQTGMVLSSVCPQNLHDLPISTIIHGVLSGIDSGLDEAHMNQLEKLSRSVPNNSANTIVHGLFSTTVFGFAQDPDSFAADPEKLSSQKNTKKQ